MSKFIERWFGFDQARAWRLEREIKVWCAYLGMLCLGGLIFCAPLAVWFDRYITAVRSQYQEEVQRLQDTNGQLMSIIQDRLPKIAKTAEDAAKTAKDAATTATTAARTAGQASGTAKAAVSNAGRAAAVAKDAASQLDRALNPPPAPPAEAPDWLNTP